MTHSRPLNIGQNFAFIYSAIQKISAITLSILGFFVICTTIFCIYYFGSPLLIADQWDNLFYIGFLHGDVPFLDLFNQHNEHRIFFPRLVFLLDAALDSEKNLINFTFNILIQLGIIWILFIFYRHLMKNRLWLTAMLGLSAILLFSLDQRENFLWGFQVQFLGVTAAAMAAFMFYSMASLRRIGSAPAVMLNILAFSMAVIACFSMANGILGAALLLPLSIIQRRRWYETLIATFCFAVLAFLYFHNFHPISYHTPYSYSLKHPLKYIEYLSEYIGNITESINIHPSKIQNKHILPISVGMIGICLSVGMTYHCLRWFYGNPWRTALLASVWFIVGTAALTTMGRMLFGLEQAASGRYLSPTSAFWCCQICYWSTLYRMNGHARFANRIALIIGLPLLAILLAAALIGHVRGWQESRTKFGDYDLAEDALLSDVNTPEALQFIYPFPKQITERAFHLRQAHLNIFADATNRLLGKSLPDALPLAPASTCTGHIDSIQKASTTLPDNNLAVEGWAWDNDARRSPRRLFLTDADNKVIGYASGNRFRPDVPEVIHFNARTNTGWAGYVHATLGQQIKAYALLKNGHVCPLNPS
ncbi:hypothetical protein K2X14_00785 [Acetobacter sp. TBRC 12305]|uniref:Transmembrane protein n=1 Tax=Acetobacter garciniae TaxID=2817435 RepID=A0A939HMN6_9PROT|nr:hypothetical protein [Acetobacter garciniae]MBO1323689.1 hypothetical protein [Acetobacter garciniae]MBX0343378.1 hypothetical protein [Acetobacter garciniae]